MGSTWTTSTARVVEDDGGVRPVDPVRLAHEGDLTDLTASLTATDLVQVVRALQPVQGHVLDVADREVGVQGLLEAVGVVAGVGDGEADDEVVRDGHPQERPEGMGEGARIVGGIVLEEEGRLGLVARAQTERRPHGCAGEAVGGCEVP